MRGLIIMIGIQVTTIDRLNFKDYFAAANLSKHCLSVPSVRDREVSCKRPLLLGGLLSPPENICNFPCFQGIKNNFLFLFLF